jgi:ribonucrease Y
MSSAFLAILFALAGATLSLGTFFAVKKLQRRMFRIRATAEQSEAESEAAQIIARAEERAAEILSELRLREEAKENEIARTKEHLEKREERLDERQAEVDRGFQDIKERIEEVRELREAAEQLIDARGAELESVARLTRDEAQELLLSEIERESADDLAARLRKLDIMGRETLQDRARDILATSIHRLASSTAGEMMTSNVPIASDDIKGKIIGKEGRNIRTFERVAGVELIVDDVPEMIIISSFDPVRREIARRALIALIEDGRIQPAKIEEFFARAQSEVNDIIKQKGEEAVRELSIFSLDPRLIAIIGRLHFRTSYGQNVLRHSIEMARIAEMIASELGADAYIAKTAALLHDIGKAIDHEFEGGHLEIGIRILRTFNVDERVVIAMRSHHDTYPHETIEAVIVQTCDIISGGRPGARRDSAEEYVKRLRELEAIADGFEGVEKSYALQAGREIRVFVSPSHLTDLQARQTARAIAVQIEEQLRYPGEIKVTVIRENRIIEFAR